jgi:hypothetical protein
MSLRRSIRTMPEGPLLILAAALVATLCLPLWQAFVGESASPWSVFTGQRLARMLLGPEQILCYACFTWAVLIIVVRQREVRRQRRGFEVDWLPTGVDHRILPEDAGLWQRRIHQLGERGGPYLLGHLMEMGLAKFGATRSPAEARAVIAAQADLEMGRLVASMGRVNYLAWAIPALGFIGTARGIGMALSVAPQMNETTLHEFLDLTTKSLAVTFDTTLVALILSLLLMFILHGQQRDEETLLLDCQQYCALHLDSRLCVLPDAAQKQLTEPSALPSLEFDLL